MRGRYLADIPSRRITPPEVFFGRRRFLSAVGGGLLAASTVARGAAQSQASLLELPFVRPSSVASFPHVLERGIRPPGGFEDFFNDRYEEFIWNSHRDDFVVAGYERYNPGLAEGAMVAKWLQAGPTRS